jgi:type II secretory pathway pseudopilin PulG
MNAQKTHKIGGFTIIEVVLVLAIAGLIFLLVFLAFPALQRSNQDTQRRNDVGRLVAQVANFQSNNNGALPATANWNSSFKTSYLTNNDTEPFADPVHGNYTLRTGQSVSAAPSDGEIWVYPDRQCSGEDASGPGAGARKVAFRIKLANGGTYCQNN